MTTPTTRLPASSKTLDICKVQNHSLNETICVFYATRVNDSIRRTMMMTVRARMSIPLTYFVVWLKTARETNQNSP